MSVCRSCARAKIFLGPSVAPKCKQCRAAKKREEQATKKLHAIDEQAEAARRKQEFDASMEYRVQQAVKYAVKKERESLKKLLESGEPLPWLDEKKARKKRVTAGDSKSSAKKKQKTTMNLKSVETRI